MYSLSFSGDPEIGRLKLGTLRSQEIIDEGLARLELRVSFWSFWNDDIIAKDNSSIE